jgi:IclR family transcriptional regulator, mhp operon transcriptional activator
MKEVSPYPEVRALERGLALIDALGEFGWLGPTELARRTGIDRATIYRLLSTLARTGFVVRRPQDAKYFLSPKIRALSFGIQEQDTRVLLISGPLRELVEEIKWPSDFAVLSAGRLVIMGSNHLLTTMTFYRSVIGQTRPVMRSSLGRAILSAMSAADRTEAIETIVLAGGPDASDVVDTAAVATAVADTRRRGFALSSGEVADNITAMALPVISGGRVAGAINVVFFRRSFRIEKALRCLEPLQRCVKKIESAFDAVAAESKLVLDNAGGQMLTKAKRRRAKTGR